MDDAEYFDKLAKYDFFPEHDTRQEKYQGLIDRMAQHYHISANQIHLI